ISHTKLEERLRSRGDSDTQINQRLSLFQKDLEELTALQKLPQLIRLTNDGNLSDAVTQFYAQLN
ncbi:MAG: guanylate kinase, partial [Enterococcus sp.]|nr:guanylate kinase [Enterococcus sp.]